MEALLAIRMIRPTDHNQFSSRIVFGTIRKLPESVFVNQVERFQEVCKRYPGNGIRVELIEYFYIFLQFFLLFRNQIVLQILDDIVSILSTGRSRAVYIYPFFQSCKVDLLILTDLPQIVCDGNSK